MCKTEKISWKLLSTISKNKFVSGTLIWVIIVPILAKLFSAIENTFSIIIQEKQYIFTLQLPFSWSLFYFSALFFLIGHIIYKARVPSIINDNETYTDFLNDGKGKHELLKYIEKENLSEDGFFELYSNDSLRDDLKHDFFWEIWNMSNLLHFKTRFIISSFYALAIFLIAIVFMQNFWFVCKHL